MKSALKNIGQFVLIMAVLLIGSAIAGHEAFAKQPTFLVPIIGRTVDGKYPRYDISGELDDANWSGNNNHTIYQMKDIREGLIYIDMKDVDKGVYVCEFVCKDKAGYIVGQNPQHK